MRRLFARSATPLAIAAILIAGGGAYALAASSSKTITVCVSHKGGALYKARKCKKHDKKLSWAKQGPRGKLGIAGTAGPQGPAGATGAQGPGGSILSYNATASASPTPTAMGTVVGDSFSGECQLVSREANALLLLTTSNGSLNMDFATTVYDVAGPTSSLYAHDLVLPAGTITSPVVFAASTATTSSDIANEQATVNQLAPAAGSLVVHTTADDTTASPSCRIEVESYPTTLSAVSGSAGASKTFSRLPSGTLLSRP